MLMTRAVQCPYCWEMIEVVIDPSEPEQDYIEDCSVCCRPIHFHVRVDEAGGVIVEALHEEDALG